MTTGTIWCLILAVSASGVTERLRDNNRIELIMKKISGLIFISLGVKLACLE